MQLLNDGGKACWIEISDIRASVLRSEILPRFFNIVFDVYSANDQILEIPVEVTTLIMINNNQR